MLKRHQRIRILWMLAAIVALVQGCTGTGGTSQPELGAPVVVDTAATVEAQVAATVAALPAADNLPAATPVAQAEAEEVVQVTPTQSPMVEPASTPRGVRNPTGPVPAGTTILADDYALVVHDVQVNSAFPDYLQLELVVTNLDSQAHLLRFQRSAITLRDDLGNVYPFGNPTEQIYENLQREIAAGQTVVFKSTRGFDWGSHVLGSYRGPVPPSASTLYIDFNGFGPFDGITVAYDL
ncbi:MAG: hypothetical protein KDI55_23455 [Anaerolineae bacterium]|nr:hypothetical protein [Anaerolineae bacterium]